MQYLLDALQHGYPGEPSLAEQRLKEVVRTLAPNYGGSYSTTYTSLSLTELIKTRALIHTGESIPEPLATLLFDRLTDRTKVEIYLAERKPERGQLTLYPDPNPQSQAIKLRFGHNFNFQGLIVSEHMQDLVPAGDINRHAGMLMLDDLSAVLRDDLKSRREAWINHASQNRGAYFEWLGIGVPGATSAVEGVVRNIEAIGDQTLIFGSTDPSQVENATVRLFTETQVDSDFAYHLDEIARVKLGSRDYGTFHQPLNRRSGVYERQYGDFRIGLKSVNGDNEGYVFLDRDVIPDTKAGSTPDMDLLEREFAQFLASGESPKFTLLDTVESITSRMPLTLLSALPNTFGGQPIFNNPHES